MNLRDNSWFYLLISLLILLKRFTAVDSARFITASDIASEQEGKESTRPAA